MISTTGLLTVPETAARLHCRPERVRALIRCGDLRATKPAGRWLIPESALAALVSESMTTRKTPAATGTPATGVPATTDGRRRRRRAA